MFITTVSRPILKIMFLVKAAGQVPHFTLSEDHKANICLKHAQAHMAMVGGFFVETKKRKDKDT